MAGGFQTFVALDPLFAADVNDKLMKQAVIQCTAATRPSSPVSGMTIWQTDTKTYAVYGTAWCETTPYSATVATSETTASTSYADLATSGPSVTITTGTKVLVTMSATVASDTAQAAQFIAPAISGATTLAAADGNGAEAVAAFASALRHHPNVRSLQIGSLTAGAQTIKLRYRVTSNTGTFINRDITAVGIPT